MDTTPKSSQFRRPLTIALSGAESTRRGTNANRVKIMNSTTKKSILSPNNGFRRGTFKSQRKSNDYTRGFELTRIPSAGPRPSFAQAVSRSYYTLAEDYFLLALITVSRNFQKSRAKIIISPRKHHHRRCHKAPLL